MNFLSSTTEQTDFQVSIDAFAAYADYMTSMITARKAEPTDDLVEKMPVTFTPTEPVGTSKS